MMKTLLLIIFLLIQPVSNEQIRNNMSDQFVNQFTPEYFQQPLAINQKIEAKAAEDDGYSYYSVIAKDGKVFTVKYYSILFGYIVIVEDDGGLGLGYMYFSTSQLLDAINAAVTEYNNSLPIGSPICLLPFGLLYLIKKRKK